MHKIKRQISKKQIVNRSKKAIRELNEEMLINWKQN